MPGAPDALGERFRAAREARGLALSDVADQIRIRSVYLAAIEDESWSTIGAPVYVRGFLRTYARFVGIDPEEAVAAFNRTQPASGTGQPISARGDGSEEGEGRRRGPLLIWVAATVAVLLIAFVVYNELTMRRPAVTASAVSAPPSPAASATPSAAVATPAPLPAGPGGPRSLALVLSAPSWLRVTIDGSVSMEGTFPAGTSKTFHGKNAMVRIGNAGGVEVYIDGKNVGKLGKSGDVIDRAFTL
jgi:transcriptional regulator with XRE-family HTH domain